MQLLIPLVNSLLVENIKSRRLRCPKLTSSEEEGAGTKKKKRENQGETEREEKYPSPLLE
jgi:hypothetical protein